MIRIQNESQDLAEVFQVQSFSMALASMALNYLSAALKFLPFYMTRFEMDYAPEAILTVSDGQLRATMEKQVTSDYFFD